MYQEGEIASNEYIGIWEKFGGKGCRLIFEYSLKMKSFAKSESISSPQKFTTPH